MSDPGVTSPGVEIRGITARDFFWLAKYDPSPLNIERDSIYLFFCVHFARTSFVAWETRGDRPAGFLLGFVPAGERHGYIHYLFVAPQHRRGGIGGALVRSFEAAAEGEGAGEVILYTARAEAFYGALGYVERNDFFAPCLDDYVRDVKGVKVMSRVL